MLILDSSLAYSLSGGMLKYIIDNSMKINRFKSRTNAISRNPEPWFSTNELLEYLGISKSEPEKQSKNF